MIIKKVDNIEEANSCDELLTCLIEDEKKYNSNLKDNYIVKDYFKNLYQDNNKILYVAKEENKIIGYVFVKIISSDEGPEKNMVALIDGLYVLPEYRGKHVATSLILQAQKWCHDMDVKYISLHVLDNNIVAKKLYQKLGFNTFYLDLIKEV